MAPKLAKLGGGVGTAALGAGTGRLAAQSAALKGLGPGGMALVETDGRRQEYNQLADDAASAGKKREGAMLFSAAEKKLEEEDFDECIKAAGDAVKLFRDMGANGKSELADALRLQISAHQVEEDAVRVATEEGAKFKDAGDKRGEGSMLLSLADLYCDKSGKGKRDKYPEAMDKVKEALDLFKAADDKKMEAIALNTKSFLHFRLFELDEAGEAVTASLALCEDLGDKATKARCLRGASVHSMLVGKIAAGIEKAKDALALYKEIGSRKWEGAFGLTLAKWLMIDEDSKKAQTAAESAYETFQGLGLGKGWEGLSLLILTDVMIEQKKAKDALKIAKDALTKFTDAGDKKGIAYAQDALTRVHLASDAPEKAIKSLEEAKTVVDELGDKSWAASLMHDFAAVHLASKSEDEALEAMGQAVEMAEEAEDEEEQAAASRALASLQVLRGNGDYKEALKAANNARDLSQQCGDKYGEAIDTLGVCVAQGMLEENNKALTAANEAQELFQELKDPRGESNALEIIAELKMMDRKYDAAVEAAEERLTIATDLGDKKMEAAAKLQIAELHCEEGEYAEAEKFCKQAMDMYQSAGDTKGEVFSMMTLIKIHSGVAGEDKADKNFKPNMEKASKVAADAVGVAGKNGDKGLRAVATYYNAMTLMFTDKLSDASKKASEAQSIYVGMGSDAGEARCLVLSAQLQLMNMNEDKALDMSDRALTVARKCGDAWAEYDAAAIVQQIQGRQQAMMQQYQMMMPADAQFAMAPQGGGGGGGGEEAPVSVAAKPKGLDPAFVRKQLMTFVKDVMATDDELELDSPFMEAGMDSLSSVSLMSMVAKEFQMALSPSLVFDFPTVRALEDHLVEESKNA